MLYSQVIYTRPFTIAEEVQKDRVAAGRAAFMKALGDQVAREEAAKQNLVVTAIDGETMQAAVLKLYQTPGSAIEKLKKAIALQYYLRRLLPGNDGVCEVVQVNGRLLANNIKTAAKSPVNLPLQKRCI